MPVRSGRCGRGTIDVFGLGQCSLDYIGRIESFPAPDTKCEFTDLTVQGGGPVATALVALARWGASCFFCGVVGDDAFGDTILASLQSEGVDTSRVLRRTGSGSQFAFIAAEPAGGRRTIFWRRPTGPAPSPAELDLELLGRARILHTDGLFPEASLAAARAARREGVTVVVDAGSMREGMLELARLSDCFIASEPFARSLTGGDDGREACRRIADLGPRIAGVTLGPRGYAALAEGSFIERPAFPAEAVDTTGCGDVFHAGVIYGLLQGWKAAASLDFAAWAAAAVSRRLGGRTGIPPSPNLFSFVDFGDDLP